MKKTVTLLSAAFILLAGPLSAQHIKQGNIFLPKKHSVRALATAAQSAAKTTATASRLIASCYREYDQDSAGYLILDTGRAFYSGQRGGDLDHQMKFDSAKVLENTVGTLENSEKTIQSFDGNDNILTAMVQVWNGSSWIDNSGYLYTYDVNSNMTSETEVTWNGTNWDSVYKYTFTYNTDNRLVHELGQSWNGSNWDNEYAFSLVLDMNGNQSIVTLVEWNGTSWDSASKNISTYNGDNFITSLLHQEWNGTMWENDFQVLTIYDGDNVVLTATQQSWVSGSWVNINIQVNTVTNTDIVNELYQMWVSNAWTNSFNIINTYDVNHNITSRTYQNYVSSAFVNSSRDLLEYNGYNQLTSEKEETWVSSSWSGAAGDSWDKYYYEDYTTAGIPGLAGTEGFKVYPVPATNSLQVEKIWSEAQPFTVSILDMQGRLIRSYSEKASTHYTRSMDVSQLAPGNYVIKLTGTKEKASYQQFTVMH